MQTQETINLLKELFHLDVDAIAAYEQALDHIDDPEIHRQIKEFRQDHIRHVSTLRDEIRRMGGVSPDPKPDLKGILIGGFTALRSLTGTEGALKAMKGNEEITNKTYRAALAKELPKELMKVIRSHYEDEQRHLQYIERTLESKPWEAAMRQAGKTRTESSRPRAH